MTSSYIYALCREVTGHHIKAFLGNSEYSWKSHSPRHPCTHFNKLFWIDMCQLPFILWHRGISNVESFSLYFHACTLKSLFSNLIFALTLVIFCIFIFFVICFVFCRYIYFLIHHHLSTNLMIQSINIVHARLALMFLV